MAAPYSSPLPLDSLGWDWLARYESEDGCTQYAIDVCWDRQLAGRHIRNACFRHLKDREAGVYHWDDGWRLGVFQVFARKIMVKLKGRMVPMELFPWQQFIVGSLLGWTVKAGDTLGRIEGTRRFRHFTLQTAKGSGKSPLLAALCLYLLSEDGYAHDGDWIPELDPEIAIIAVKLEQARQTMINPMAKAIRDNPDDLGANFRVQGDLSPTGIMSKKGGGRIYLLSSNSKGVHGPIWHGVAGDEQHEWDNAMAFQSLCSGTKSRAQALTIACSNAPNGDVTVAGVERESAVQAAQGRGSDSHFAAIFEVDPEDPQATGPTGEQLYYKIPAARIKANPSIELLNLGAYVQGEMDRATGAMAVSEAQRLQEGIMPGGDGSFLTGRQLRDCYDDGKVFTTLVGTDLIERYIAWDAARRGDMFAVAVLDATATVGWLRVHYFYPMEQARALDHLATAGRVQQWGQEGFATLPPGEMLRLELPGRYIADQAVLPSVNGKVPRCFFIGEHHLGPEVVEAINGFGMRLRWPWKLKGDETKEHHAIRPGIVTPYRKGYKGLRHGISSELGLAALEEGVISARAGSDAAFRLFMEANPIWEWNLESTWVKRSPAGPARMPQRKPGRVETTRIDGVDAAVMVLALWRKHVERPKGKFRIVAA